MSNSQNESQKYFKYIKLKSGTDLICITHEPFLFADDFANRKFIELYDVIELDKTRYLRDNKVIEGYTMKPWIVFTDQGCIDLPTDTILVMADCKESVVEQYITYLSAYVLNQLLSQNKEQNNFFEELMKDEEEETSNGHTLH